MNRNSTTTKTSTTSTGLLSQPTRSTTLPFSLTKTTTNIPTINTTQASSSSSVTHCSQPSRSSVNTPRETSSSSVITAPQQVTVNRNVPQFLNKLYNMVNDPASNGLIRWSKDGTSFIVQRHEEFARLVLPRFFKHNNFASFVRQLNMYGFHKVPHLQQGVLHSETEELWEFSNAHFQRNQPDLLCLVTRKKGQSQEDKEGNGIDIASILGDINAIKKHQMAISTDLKNMQRDNQVLWQETMSARDRHNRHQETIDKILRFLATVFSSEKEKPVIPNKKRRLLLVDSDTSGHDEDFDRYIALPVPEDKEPLKTTSYLPNSLPKTLSNSLPNTLPNTLPNVPLIPEFSNDVPLFSGEELLSSDNLENTLTSGQNIVSPIPGVSLTPETAAAFQLLNNSLPDGLSSIISTDPPTDLAPVQNMTTNLHNTSKSVEAIQSDIDTLQSNIDSLTSQLGFEPGQELDLSEMETLLAEYGAENGEGALFELMGGSPWESTALTEASSLH